MNKRIVLSLLLALSFGLASAVTVRGGPSCAAWINDRDSRDINRFWLLGYLSGLSVALNKDVLKNTDNSALSAWIDNYCRANSLKNLEEAGADLFFELKKQKGL